MGQRRRLTETDIQKIIHLYNCGTYRCGPAVQVNCGCVFVCVKCKGVTASLAFRHWMVDFTFKRKNNLRSSLVTCE